MSTNLAFGAGGPQRRKSIPTAARLAQLRHRAIKARMQGLGSGRREGRTLLAVDQDVPQIINERTSRNLANTFPFVGGNRSTDAVKCGFVVDKMQFCIITEIRSEPSESICSGWCKQVPAEFC